jgi:glycogen debranching enzyme-like protein
MEYGHNTTYVQYELPTTPANIAQTEPLTLTLSPFCLYRDHHSTTHGDTNWHFLVENQGNRCRIRAYEAAPACMLVLGHLPNVLKQGNGSGGEAYARHRAGAT